MKTMFNKQKLTLFLTHITGKTLLLCLFTSGVVFYLLLQNKITLTRHEPDIVTAHVLPKQNMLVYTKYTSYDWYWKRECGCSLYVSQLGNPNTEQKIYTFTLAKNTQFATIEGIVDKRVIYTLFPRKLGIVSLVTGKNTYITTHDFIGPYIDKTNKKIYFTTEGPNPDENNNLYVYDIQTATTTRLANLSKLDPTHVTKKVIYATKDQVYLSYISRVGSDSNIWNKTFALNTHTVTEAEFSKDNVSQMVFSDNGKKISYLINENGLLHVHVYNRNTQKDVEIFTTSSGIPNGSGTYKEIINIQFNKYSDALSFTVTSFDPNTHEPIKTNYISQLEIRKVPDDAKGIILLPEDNPDIYKDIKTITVIKNPFNGKNPFQWIEYNNDAILFDDKNITYLASPYTEAPDDATPILINADHIQFVDTP